jgi:2-methylcitrate dehydratase PrpD
MDAALRLQEEHGFVAADIEEIEASVPAPVFPIVCKPLPLKAAPPTPYGALFSLPFCVAFVIVHGSFGVGDVNETTIRDRRILDVGARVRCQPLAASSFPAAYPGRIRVRLRNGRTIEGQELVNRGHPDNPLRRADVIAKFRAAASQGAPRERLSAIMMAVDRIERGPIDALTGPLAGAVEKAW